MSDQQREEPHGRIPVLCPACRGEGHFNVPTAGAYQGEMRTMFSHKTCKHCNCTGRIVGLRPPV
ncbi:hypothetical protein ABZ639_09305 [Saccharomonospora sp. NPDC006951]